jgi:hypothetical protein
MRASDVGSVVLRLGTQHRDHWQSLARTHAADSSSGVDESTTVVGLTACVQPGPHIKNLPVHQTRSSIRSALSLQLE